jgi:hypothetical protein
MGIVCDSKTCIAYKTHPKPPDEKSGRALQGGEFDSANI